MVIYEPLINKLFIGLIYVEVFCTNVLSKEILRDLDSPYVTSTSLYSFRKGMLAGKERPGGNGSEGRSVS